MAEGFLSDFAVALTSKVGSLLLDEIVLLCGVKDELAKLKETVDTVGTVLLDAEEKSIHSRPVKQWLEKLSEAMYDAEDLLDEFSYEALHRQLMGGSGTSKKVRLFFSRSNKVAFSLKMAHKVKELRKRFDEIADLRHKFHLEDRSAERRPFSHSTPPQVVIGREADKEEIVKNLLSSGLENWNVSFLAVHGIGGLGKTTLAQMVYNDDRVESRFELKIWVCVSDEFDVQLLVKKVIESATKQAPLCNEMEPLKDLLHEQIKGKRYLLVLDDVWNDDGRKWSCFIDLFANGAKGSKILITTRSLSVAQACHATSVHELHGLPENESWSLFKQVAFNQSHHLWNQSWDAIGSEIVKRCCGNPLAIKSIAGVLYSKDPNIEWGPFKDDEVSKINVFREHIEPILRLSYNHLPSPYKRCFAYCCLFAKDLRIQVEKLIQLWEAQGYVQSTHENGSLRDISLRYFKDLLLLSFFQDVEEDSLGNIKYCKMHDLILNLAVSVAGDNFSVSAPCQITSIKRNIQHMSLCHASSLLKLKKVRTILKLKQDEPHAFGESEADALFRNLRCLRVLDLSRMGIRTLPNSIFKMKLLRYLDLSHNIGIKELPKSLVCLHNLQGLNLEGCSNLRKWPSDMSKLVNLTDLNNGECNKLSYIPSGIGKLTKLEKLSTFVIAVDQSISKHSARLDELHPLDNLRGELEIKNLCFVENAASEFREGLLSSKHNLQKLKLYNVGDQEMVMEALCPHPNLKALEVFSYEGLKPPSWLPSITNLMDVTIRYCNSIQRLPLFDQLIHLQKLDISEMSELENIQVEYGGGSSPLFPSLTHLVLRSCPKLKGFERLSKEEFPCFPCLSDLSIHDCRNLVHLPLSPGVEMWDFDADVQLSSKILTLKNYSGLKTPSWLPSITNLVGVEINSCSSIQRLPPLDHLIHLQRLRIYRMPELESIEVKYGGGSSPFFPSLIHLTLRSCPKLKGFERLSSLSEEELPCFPRLSSLSIRGCLNLIHLPPFPGVEMRDFDSDVQLSKEKMMLSNYGGSKPPSWLPSITNLVDVTIRYCNSIQRLPSFEQLIHLQKLAISTMPELESIEVEYGGGSSPFFPSLAHLTLRSCPKLKGFERLSSLSEEELPCFPCLSYLFIHVCPNVIQLPLSAKLETLRVCGVKSLIEMLNTPANSAITLSKLQELRISDMEDCTENELSDGMHWQSLEALHTVSFDRMKNMVSLPNRLQHATTLQHLRISRCLSFECVPEWMPNLIALKDLIIKYSPKGEERCDKNSAEDWHKISHIPDIRIGGILIQSNGRYLL